MELIKVSSQTIKDIVKKKIICYVKASDYIQEFDDKYGLVGKIEAIIEDFKNRRTDCIVCERTIPVYSFDYLYGIDWDKYVLIITSDYYWKIYDNLEKNSSKLLGLQKVYRFSNAESEYLEYYCAKYSSARLKNIIVFRSGPKYEIKDKQWDFTDNTRAFFEYIVKADKNNKFKKIWYVKDINWAKANYNFDENTTYFIPEEWAFSENDFEREQYYESLFLAKYIIFDHADSFVRMPHDGQIRVQLWHGQGYKGRIVSTDMSDRCEFMPVMSAKYAEIHGDIFGLRKNQLLITGIPKQDWCFIAPEKKIMEKIGMPSSSKYIFWLPTWRSTQWNNSTLLKMGELSHGNWSPIPIDDYDNLNELLEYHDICLVIKLHQSQKTELNLTKKYSNIVFLDGNLLADLHIHINQLLNCADALISDYSSVINDFLLLNRPIGLAVSDMDVYQDKMGFVFDNIEDWLPGDILITYEDLVTFITNIGNGLDSSKEKRQSVAERLCKYSDNRNCERLADSLGICFND